MAIDVRPTVHKQRTAWAAVCAVPIYALLYPVYSLICSGIVELYARHDESFRYGFGALIMALAPSVLASLGAMIIVVRIFRYANHEAVFYSFATLTVALLALTVLVSLAEHHRLAEVVWPTVSAAAAIAGAKVGTAMGVARYAKAPAPRDRAATQP